MVILADDSANAWDPIVSERLNWRWQSKQFHLDTPINLGAFRIEFETSDLDDPSQGDTYYSDYNETLFPLVPSGVAGSVNDKKGLATLNSSPLGGSPAANTGLVAGWLEPETICGRKS